MVKKSKTICLLDSQKYFIRLQTVYYNKRISDFSKVENGYDIEKPDINFLLNNKNFRALWNEKTSDWSYEDTKKNELVEPKEKTYKRQNEDPMFYVRTIRNKKLHESDQWLLTYHENDKEVPKSVQEYRKKLREIPNKIRLKEITEPKLIDPKSISNFANPENYIEFDWPEKPKLEL